MISDVIRTYLEEELNINEVLTDDEKNKILYTFKNLFNTFTYR